MTAAQLRRLCLGLQGAQETFPFAPGVSVFKTPAGKMFALARLEATPLAVSVKCDPDLAEALRGDHASIVPGYHLNKRHWITVTIGGDAPDALVRSLVEDSYALVARRAKGS